MDEDEKTQAIQRELADALQQAFGKVYPGDLVTRWAVVAETIDGESSDRALSCVAPADLKVWDVLGLLTFALERERAGFIGGQD